MKFTERKLTCNTTAFASVKSKALKIIGRMQRETDYDLIRLANIEVPLLSSSPSPCNSSNYPLYSLRSFKCPISGKAARATSPPSSRWRSSIAPTRSPSRLACSIETPRSGRRILAVVTGSRPHLRSHLSIIFASFSISVFCTDFTSSSPVHPFTFSP